MIEDRQREGLEPDLVAYCRETPYPANWIDKLLHARSIVDSRQQEYGSSLLLRLEDHCRSIIAT
jgi:hypothetical protein